MFCEDIQDMDFTNALQSLMALFAEHIGMLSADIRSCLKSKVTEWMNPIFTPEYVEQFYKNKSAARAAIKRLEALGQIIRIRRGLYTAISGETDAPLASRFQIASALTLTSCVSHHTAMEYYGITDQVFYDV